MRSLARVFVVLTLAWIDNAAGQANFQVERRIEPDGMYARIAVTEAAATPYVDATVLRRTTYCYRVRASNAFGDSAYSNEACARTGKGRGPR